jgi:hypothetical protein
MPLPANVVKINMRGTGVGSEIWQAGLWWKGASDVTSQADLQSNLDAAVAAYTTFWNSCKPNIATGFAWTGLTAYWYAGGPTALYVASHDVAAAPGTLTGNGSPLDTSLVISLITKTSGRSFRGRMYMPCHAPVPVGTGLWAGQAATYSAAAATMMLAVEAATAHTWGPVVASRKLGVFNFVNFARCDSLPDVQRRRENRMSKGNITSTLVIA